MEEIWKDISGYEGLYQVSNTGCVRSLNRKVKIRRETGDYEKTVPGKELRQWMAGGYYHVTLSKNGIIKAPFVHKLVAEAFIPKQDGYRQINHIDEVKTNNDASNLEWCDQKYNRNYGTGEARRLKSFTKNVESHRRKRKPVLQLDKSGSIVRRYYSMTECEKYGFHSCDVHSCCTGRLKTYKGYIWRYA